MINKNKQCGQLLALNISRFELLLLTLLVSLEDSLVLSQAMLRHIKCNLAHSPSTYLTRNASTSFSRPTLRELNANVNALVHIPPEKSQPDSHNGPLGEMTVAVKDNICTSDMPTTCSSEMLRNFHSPFDATVVQLLKSAGAEIVGKANCDEFGMGYV